MKNWMFINYALWDEFIYEGHGRQPKWPNITVQLFSFLDAILVLSKLYRGCKDK